MPDPEPTSDPTPDGDRDADRVRAELSAVLEADRTALGDVYRGTEAGETREEIAAARGITTTGFIWQNRRTIRAILDGSLPTAPTVAGATARTIRRILKENDLSPETQRVLDERLDILNNRAADPGARSVEEKEALVATAKAEDLAIPGIYVYTLPHYLRYPYEESGRTLFKVGRADSSVIRRFREQTRTTALPEDPVLLRIYKTDGDESTKRESSFHRLLEAADHDRSAARTGGTEWFLTSIRFLDEIADTIGLPIEYVADIADYTA